VTRRLILLFCALLLAVAPFRAATAQQGQRLSLIRDAEIESAIRAFVTPIWRVAGLNPDSVDILIVQDNSLNAFVAGGQRIFVNTGLLLRTERPNQLIGVLAHETGHIAGGHLSRQQEELRNLSVMQIIESILAVGALAGSAGAGGTTGRGGPTGGGQNPAPGSILNFLKYTQTQENSADQAAIQYLERTRQSPRGTVEFLRVMLQRERMLLGRQDPYLTTHPLTQDRLATFEEAAARSPYANAPDSAAFIDMHGRVIAKLLGFTAPDAALQRYSAADTSVIARYARGIALYRKNNLPQGLAIIDGLIKEHPNDPYFHELRGQALFENARAVEAIPSYRRAVQLLPTIAILKVDFARALLETNRPEDDREAVRNLEIASQAESDNFELWRLLSVGYARQNNHGLTSLARAEMAVIRGQRSEAQAHAAAAVRQLQPGTPAWQRAQDISAYIASRPKKN
jgi:predicted Zn-dependent protease